MSTTIEGTFIKKLAPVTGPGANGEWTKQDFVIQTGGDYPKEVCFSVWNNKPANFATLQANTKCTVHFEASSREHNEKYYTELKCWKLDFAAPAYAPPAAAAPAFIPSATWPVGQTVATMTAAGWTLATMVQAGYGTLPVPAPVAPPAPNPFAPPAAHAAPLAPTPPPVDPSDDVPF